MDDSLCRLLLLFWVGFVLALVRSLELGMIIDHCDEHSFAPRRRSMAMMSNDA
jgi:hypothetical protein